MTKKVIVDLIRAHYENDSRTFFSRTIDVLKEFKADGDDELIKYIDFILKCNVKIAPKREVTKLEDLDVEISFDDAKELGWIMEPQAKPQDGKRVEPTPEDEKEIAKIYRNWLAKNKECI